VTTDEASNAAGPRDSSWGLPLPRGAAATLAASATATTATPRP
jgi:hypothetical protein